MSRYGNLNNAAAGATSGYIPKATGTSGQWVWATATDVPGVGAGKQEYTTGSGNWTCPTGVTRIWVTMCGGGGGGGVGANDADVLGMGGGGGALIIKRPFTVTPTNTYAYSVGGGGTGKAKAGPGAGGNGTDTTFNSITVEGGLGDETAPNGTGKYGQAGESTGAFKGSGGNSMGLGGLTLGAAGEFGGGGAGGRQTVADGGAGGSGYILIEW